MVEVVRAEDREAVVNADRKKGRKNNGDFAKQKTIRINAQFTGTDILPPFREATRNQPCPPLPF